MTDQCSFFSPNQPFEKRSVMTIHDSDFHSDNYFQYHLSGKVCITITVYEQLLNVLVGVVPHVFYAFSTFAGARMSQFEVQE